MAKPRFRLYNLAPCIRFNLPVRANWASILLAAHIFVTAASILVTLAEIRLLGEIAAGSFVADSELAASDTRRLAIYGLFLGTTAAVAVAFLMWIHRSSRNLASLGVVGQRFSPGWSVGWWFIPFANLVQPYRSMSEIWRGSVPSGSAGVDESPMHASPSPLMGWWWAGWIISVLLYAVANALAPEYADSPYPDHQALVELVNASIASDWVEIAADFIQIISGIIFIVLIRQITSNQTTKSGYVADPSA